MGRYSWKCGIGAMTSVVALAACGADPKSTGSGSAVASARPSASATDAASSAPSGDTGENAKCTRRTAPCDGMGKLDSGGHERTFRFHLPPKGREKPPLVLALHGHGGDAEEFERVTHLSKIADDDGFVVVYPNGFKKSWADARGTSDASVAGIDDVAFLSALIDKQIAELGADASKVVVIGFSNGAMMAQRVGCELAGKVTAIAPVSGTFALDYAPKCAPAKPLTVIEFHGDADDVVPFAGGDLPGKVAGKMLSAPASAARWAELDHCTATPVTTDEPDVDPKDGTKAKRSTFSGCAQGSKVVFFTIENGGHKWPVGPDGNPAHEGDHISHDVDAGRVICDLTIVGRSK